MTKPEPQVDERIIICIKCGSPFAPPKSLLLCLCCNGEIDAAAIHMQECYEGRDEISLAIKGNPEPPRTLLAQLSNIDLELLIDTWVEKFVAKEIPTDQYERILEALESTHSARPHTLLAQIEHVREQIEVLAGMDESVITDDELEGAAELAQLVSTRLERIGDGLWVSWELRMAQRREASK